MAALAAGVLVAGAWGAVAVPGVAGAAEYPGTTDSAVTFTVPDEVEVGGPIVVSGTGWTDTAGTAGSIIALKLDDGGVSTTVDVTHPVTGAVQANKTIYGVVQAGADGAWTASLPYPTAANSTGAGSWAAGQTHSVRMLTGTLLTGDKLRSEGASFTLVDPAGPGDPGDPGDPGEPGGGTGSISITAVVPDGGPGGPGDPGEDGPLSLSVDPGAVVALTALPDQGDRLAFGGTLPAVTVTDARSDATAAGGGWSVSAQSSDFTAGSGVITASHLGWTPSVATPKDGLVAGPEVAGALDAGPGLASSAVLASASGTGRAGSAEVGADLELAVPVDTAAGSYAATLTVSLFPTD